MLEPKEVLSVSVVWLKVRDGLWKAKVRDVDCSLRLNDFPEEPLYTVTVGERSLDIDDVPSQWQIEF